MWVDASLWKKTEARGGFMLTELPNMLCSRHGGPRVKLSLSPFVDGFQDLPRQFGRVWRSEMFNGFEILLVQWNPALRPPRYYDHIFVLQMNWNSSHFLSITTSLIRPPRYYHRIFRGPKVVVLTGFHCSAGWLDTLKKSAGGLRSR